MISIEIIEKSPSGRLLARWNSTTVVPVIGDTIELDEGSYRIVERAWHDPLDVLLVAKKEFPPE
ncbi:hypothetical protein CA850_32860 [Micromonospora echinospora]|uniref:Uncharacterized protein n=1 Tax=Micromonospora echinospora TaxID=1877 RepID=A0A1C4YR33_MICEC|nr:hypothetical protein [Micromonospora echinospora]OZV71800.1 hypothetical protein CA850_32860 [Micromonospora echinospora]SCF23252.1 hypothetical protein GA0070618_4273 [Micromonospora echinospora]